MQYKPLILALLAGLSLSGAAQATLIDRGGGLIYDQDRDITWLADANYAKTQYTDSGGTLGDVDGRMNWQTAMDWVANLSYFDSVRGVTYDDWRLPTTLQPDTGCSIQVDMGAAYGIRSNGYNCTGSEMGHLFYTEGGLSANQTFLSSAILTTNFIDIRADHYWSGMEYAPNVIGAWLFSGDSGFQRVLQKSNEFFALAVRPGDVASTVPEPATLLLLALGLAGLGVMRRRG